MFRSGPVDDVTSSCSLRKRRIELLGKVERLADTLDLSGQEPGRLGESEIVDEWFNDEWMCIYKILWWHAGCGLHLWECAALLLAPCAVPLGGLPQEVENCRKERGEHSQGAQWHTGWFIRCMYEKGHKLDLSFVACRGMLPAFRSWPKPAQQTKSAEWMEKAPRRAKHYNFSLNKQRMQVHII